MESSGTASATSWPHLATLRCRFALPSCRAMQVPPPVTALGPITSDSQNKFMKISCLLGAGISIPAGLPTTKQLTDLILKGDGWYRHTDSQYYSGGQGRDADKRVSAIVEYLDLIQREITLFYQHYQKDQEHINYEVLYYVLTQIDDSLHGEFENPAIHPLIEKIRPKAEDVLLKHGVQWNYIRFSEEVKRYVKCVVSVTLRKPPLRKDHLGLLVDLCLDRSRDVSIFTLNHDTILENVLRGKGVVLNDGFSNVEEGVRYWEPEGYDRADGGIRYFKLHGSVDWVGFVNGQTGVVVNGDYNHVKNAAGEWMNPTAVPKVLIGTFNKLLSYAGGIYSELYWQFHRELKSTDVLVVSGYSFGDKGINSRVKEWLISHPARRMVVLHNNPETLYANARGAIRNSWHQWVSTKTVICINKWLADTPLAEVLQSLHSNREPQQLDRNEGQSLTSDI